jgi:hypothetical protein
MWSNRVTNKEKDLGQCSQGKGFSPKQVTITGKKENR